VAAQRAVVANSVVVDRGVEHPHVANSYLLGTAPIALGPSLFSPPSAHRRERVQPDHVHADHGVDLADQGGCLPRLAQCNQGYRRGVPGRRHRSARLASTGARYHV